MKKIIILLVFFGHIQLALCSSYGEKKLILVTAKASSSKLVSDDSEKYQNAAFHPMTYRIKFKKINVELGATAEYPSSKEFDVVTSTDYMILNADQVSLLIDVSDSGNHKLVSLDIVSRISCHKTNVLDSTYEDYYFNMDFKNDSDNQLDMNCVILDGEHFPPPERILRGQTPLKDK